MPGTWSPERYEQAGLLLAVLLFFLLGGLLLFHGLGRLFLVAFL